jgi:DNA-binding NarL/FixJ family response regulator
VARDVTTPTEKREIATLRAYLRTGSTKKAAAQLGVTDSTVRQRLARYYARIGVSNAAQAAYLLDRPEDWHSQI